MGEPLVSVVIPTYNRADLLARAIESVQRQTLEDLEIIVVDDGSRDATPSVVDRYRAGDARVRSVRFRTNRGACACRNRGIDEARGRYLAFLDDDDAYRARKLERMVPALERTDERVVLAYSRVLVQRGDGRNLEVPGSGPSGSIYEEVLRGLWFQTGSTLVRREGTARFDESLPCLQDVDYHLKMLRRREAVYVDEITAVQHVDHDYRRITHQSPHDLKAAVRILERRHYQPHRTWGMRAGHGYLLGFAGKNIMAEDRRMARRYLRRAARLNPTPKVLSLLAVSWLPHAWISAVRNAWFRSKLLVQGGNEEER